MLYNLKKNIQRSLFERAIRTILHTPPLVTTDDNVMIVSMLKASDLHMYLLAIKSFYRFLKIGRVTVVADRDIDEAATNALRTHIPAVRIVPIETIDVGPCQQGGTWERLLYILEQTANHYVIQLDADTLCQGPDIREVVECVRANRPFVLAGSELTQLVSMSKAAEMAAQIEGEYIGNIAERNFAALPQADTRRYLRASSAFAGFSRGGASRALVEEFHGEMEAILGTRWREWGTEQCASNYAIANSPDPLILPYDRYLHYWPPARHDFRKSNFIHFLGTYRYDGGLFGTLGRKIIDELGRM